MVRQFHIMLVIMIIIPAGQVGLLSAEPATAPASQPANETGNLEYWLDQAQPVETPKPDSVENDNKESDGKSPSDIGKFYRDDALPGVVELSDGRQLAGGIFTTRDQPMKIWRGEEKRWQPIPPAAVLSISAVVVQEEMQLRWRWKAMGEPEKIYTGKSYPFRRFEWKLHMADDSTIQGSIKGQPVWVETKTETLGPFILHERAKGEIGQSLKDQIYIRKIVISRKMMEKVQQGQDKD